MLTMFARLAGREQMPAHERLRASLSGGGNAPLRPGRIGAVIIRAPRRLGDGLRTAVAALAAADRWLAGQLPDAARDDSRWHLGWRSAGTAGSASSVKPRVAGQARAR
jgi:hypothetical protein